MSKIIVSHNTSEEEISVEPGKTISIPPGHTIKLQYCPNWRCNQIETRDVTPAKLNRLMDSPLPCDFFLVADDGYISGFTVDFIKTGRRTKAVISFDGVDD